MDPKVDQFLDIGCGRCGLVGTPQCKINKWRDSLTALREICLECGLEEGIKWGQPCYTFKGKNVVLIHGFKEYCAIMFFKGALLQDPEKILVQQTENVQATRQIRFSRLKDVLKLRSRIKSFIFEAIELERTGKKVQLKSVAEFAVPDELREQFRKKPLLKKAFEALTPGRQRGYLLFFSAPKQSKTRIDRISKCERSIMRGKGLHDDYKK